MITLERGILEQMVKQARQELPNECCGILAGQKNGEDTEIIDIYPLKNIDQSPEHFSMDPKEQFEAYYAIRDRGLKLLGNYHSHPATPSRPSREDIRLAHDPEALYAILSLAGTDPVLKFFRIKEGLPGEIPLFIKEKPHGI